MAQPLNLRAPEGASQAVCRRAMRNGTLLRVALLHEVRLAADALAADAAAAPGACTVASGGQQHTGSTTAAPADAQATTAAPGETDTAAAAVSAPAADALPAAHRDLSLSGLQIVATELFDTVPLPRDYTALNGLSQRAEAAAGAGMALLGLLQRLHPSQLQQLQQQHPRERTVKDQSPQPRPAPDDRSISEPGRVSAALETLERAQQDWLSSPQLQRNEHLTVRFNVSKAGPTGAGYDPSSQQVIAERLLRLQQSLPALSSAAKAVLLRLTQPVQTQLLQAEAAEGVPAAAGSVAVAAAAHVTPAGGYSAAAAAAPLSKVQVTVSTPAAEALALRRSPFCRLPVVGAVCAQERFMYRAALDRPSPPWSTAFVGALKLSHQAVNIHAAAGCRSVWFWTCRFRSCGSG